jgi:hypothetical protein
MREGVAALSTRTDPGGDAGVRRRATKEGLLFLKKRSKKLLLGG